MLYSIFPTSCIALYGITALVFKWCSLCMCGVENMISFFQYKIYIKRKTSLQSDLISIMSLQLYTSLLQGTLVEPRTRTFMEFRLFKVSQWSFDSAHLKESALMTPPSSLLWQKLFNETLLNDKKISQQITFENLKRNTNFIPCI